MAVTFLTDIDKEELQKDIEVGVKFVEQNLAEEQKKQARENIGAVGNVFVAEYGKTTYAEIAAAHEEGKAVFCISPEGGLANAGGVIWDQGGTVFALKKIDEYRAKFVGHGSGSWHITVIVYRANDKWEANGKTLLTNDNIADSIADDAPYNSVPSVTAVCDYVEDHPAVRYDFGQELTEDQKAQARENIDALGKDDVAKSANPDWNQNDVSQPDYIKNRPFYTQGAETVVPLDEKYIPDSIARVKDIPEGFSGSWNDLTDKPFGEIYQPLLHESEFTTAFDNDKWVNRTTLDGLYEYDLTGGATYAVVFNGKVYEGECKEDGYWGAYLGNHVLLDPMGVDNGLPFCICVDKTSGACDLRTTEAGTYTVAVSRIDHKDMDESYIPDSIARVVDIPEIPTVDATLTEPGSPADAKAVGDALADVNAILGLNSEVILEVTEVAVESTSATVSKSLNLVFGEEYIVSFNGSTYFCTAKDVSMNNSIGNAHLVASRFEDTGEPFLISQGYNSFVLYTNVPGTYRVGVFKGDKPVTTETWTFELEDGTTVTKQVVVK